MLHEIAFMLKRKRAFEGYKKRSESGTIVPLLQKKQRICRCFLHGYDSLAKIELLNKTFRKAIPCTFTITQIKRLYH